MLWTTFDFRPVNAWEKRKLGDVVERVTRKNKNIESTLPLTISAQNGLVDQRTFFSKTIAGKDTKNYLLLKSGEFAYNRSYSVGNPWGAVRRLDRYPSGILSSLYIAFKPLEIDSQFLVAYFNGSSWYRAIRKVAAEGARNHGLLNISASDFFDQEMMIPAEQSEQEIIGFTLDKVDDLIAATQDKLDCLERVKKALLQHLFDQSMRFKGYSDPWEKRKLGNISEIRTGPFGSVLHAKDYVDDGVPIITTEHFKSGALPTCKFNLPQVSAEDFRRLKSYNLQPGDVVFSRVGSVDVSAEVLPLQDGWLFSGRVLRVRPKESVSGAFLHYVLSTTLIKRNIRSRAVGQTMPSINTKILNDTSIVLPHKTSEQNKISSALANLDSLIAATQSKLSSLESLKKALLQGLFI